MLKSPSTVCCLLLCFALLCVALFCFALRLLCAASLYLAVLGGCPWRPLVGPAPIASPPSTVAAGLGLSLRFGVFTKTHAFGSCLRWAYGHWPFRCGFAMVDLETCLPPTVLDLFFCISLAYLSPRPEGMYFHRTFRAASSKTIGKTTWNSIFGLPKHVAVVL